MTPGFRVGLFIGVYFAANGINGFMPLWFADRGLSAGDIGQILAAVSLLRVLAGPQWGSFSDRIGRRRPVLIGTAMAAAVMALLYQLTSGQLTSGQPTSGFFAILLVAAGQGIAASAINPLLDSLALALARQKLMEYAPVRSVGSATFMLATAVTGWLSHVFSTQLIPLLLAGCFATCAACGRILPEAPTPAHKPRRWGGIALFRLPAFRLAVLSTALIQGAHAAYYGFAALFWRSEGLTDQTIGLLIAEGIVVEVLLFAKGRRLIEHLGPAGLTGCAAAASVLRWGITACAPPLPILIAVQLLHAMTFGMQHLSAMRLLSHAIPPERAATAQALHASLGYGAPTGLMMLLSGLLYARYGGLVFLAMAAVGGLALLLVRPLGRASR